MLADHQISRLVRFGEIQIEPWDRSLLQPASIDVRLGSEFMRYTYPIEEIDPFRRELPINKIHQNDTVIRAGEFILATTLERVKLPSNYSAQLNGKSTLGRLGLVVHATAGFIDPGFEGNITLELTNFNKHSIRLRAGMRIAQLHFFEMSEPSEFPYGHEKLNSHYQGQTGVTPPVILS